MGSVRTENTGANQKIIWQLAYRFFVLSTQKYNVEVFQALSKQITLLRERKTLGQGRTASKELAHFLKSSAKP
ncbi:hypothetical protein KSF_103740 [Reticulibacter mediterranei]|uniref:Uncharacterized protein n=1 Tax=Reticulibacter mediterranei TaxID=2778369 RepID=A0A8J3J408_9CHLR|nr:hypothetical protein KSF_103740 [Reticulibacter mediterranei]